MRHRRRRTVATENDRGRKRQRRSNRRHGEEAKVSDGQGSDGKMRCPTCGKDNACGMANGAASCWCFAMPHVLPVSKADEAARCYCRACLAGVIAAQAASN